MFCYERLEYSPRRKEEEEKKKKETFNLTAKQSGQHSAVRHCTFLIWPHYSCQGVDRQMNILCVI